MPKKPYTGNYRKRMSSTKASSNAGLGDMQPPVQSDANQIASPNESGKFFKKGKSGKSINRRY